MRADCSVSKEIQVLAVELLQPFDVVLEIGARYGSVSCAVSIAQNNSGRLITVEADPDVWAIHQYNKLENRCAGFSVFGVLGSQDQTVLSNTSSYGKATTLEKNARGVKVSHFTWDEIEKATGLKINTIIFDCEGCIFPIMTLYKHKFSQIEKVIIENDKTAGWECEEDCQAVNQWLEGQGMVMTHTFIGISMHQHFVFKRDTV